MRLSRAAWLLIPFVLASCGKPAEPETPGDKTLGPILHNYVVEFLRRNPTTNTYLGGAGFDPKLRDVDATLRDYSAAGLAGEDQWLKKTQGELTAIQPATLETIVIAATSAAATSSTCPLPAPNQVKRRRVAS